MQTVSFSHFSPKPTKKLYNCVYLTRPVWRQHQSPWSHVHVTKETVQLYLRQTQHSVRQPFYNHFRRLPALAQSMALKRKVFTAFFQLHLSDAVPPTNMIPTALHENLYFHLLSSASALHTPSYFKSINHLQTCHLWSTLTFRAIKSWIFRIIPSHHPLFLAEVWSTSSIPW